MAETDFHHIFVLPDDRGFLFHPHADLTFDSIHLFDGTERHEVLRLEGTTLNSAAYTAGHLVFTRSFENPGVWAVPFSLDRLETTGDPFMVIPDGSFPTVSRNGDLAYVPESPISGQIVRLDPQGRVTGEIGETTVGMDDLQVSPDGREALVVIDGDNYELWVVDLETAERRRLTFSREEISGPSWSADGERIVYTAGNSSHTLFQQIIERDGTPVDAVDVRGYSPRLSHDGRYLVLSNWDEANDPDIGYVDLQDPDAGTVPIVDSPFAETAPRLSPDDRWVLYASTESGQSEIMLRSFPDGDQERQVSSEGGYAAMWDPSGERIYYRTPGSGWIMSVDVSRDPLRLSAPRRAFAIDTAREVTLASDGSFYGLRMSAGGSQGVYSVWLNWGQGLGD